jgi:hypothetical protein
MKDPFQRPQDTLVNVASVALSVVIDQAGGSLVVTTEQCDTVRAKFGGAVGVKGKEDPPGTFTFTLVPIEPSPAKPLS